MSSVPPELSRLLQCLHATPEDDLLWLAVGDCLEENGESFRAELLRLNRQLRDMPEDEMRWKAEERVRELVNGGVVPCVPELVNSIGMRFALIPPGTFWMGSSETEEEREDNETLHKVTLTRPFWLGVFPVTQAQWQAVTGSNPSYFSATGKGEHEVAGLDTSSFPVEQVSWDDAVAFCAALSEKEGLGHSCRLPTEAEWEYACRGGLLSKPFHFDNNLDKSQANFDESGLDRTCAVGNYAPNAWGLYDMHGNVWEWCQDWYGGYPAGPVADPSGPADASQRVYRGGSWDDAADYCRAAYRNASPPANSYCNLGLRLVRVPVQEQAEPGAQADGRES